jgi:hypothetical protein
MGALVLTGCGSAGSQHPVRHTQAAAVSSPTSQALPPSPSCDISGWEANGNQQAVVNDFQQLNSAVQTGDTAEMQTDGTQLKDDALIALHNLPPKCAPSLRHNYKEMMVFYGIAGAAIAVSGLDPNGPAKDYRVATAAIKHGLSYFDKVQAEEAALGG